MEMFGDQLADIPGISKEDTTALEQLVGVVVAKTVTQFAGGTAADGNAAAINAKLATEFNRQLHPTEERMIKENAARFARELYKTQNPTSEQIAGATSLLANTAQTLVDNNLGYDVPYSPQAEAFLYTLQKEYAAVSPNLSIGDGQQLFYATPEQRNQPWINTGTSDKYIAGIIIKAPIKPIELPGAPKSNRDRLTGLPLDNKGRYSQQIVVNGTAYQPKYHPCATAECLGHNLDTADPGTQAYIKAMDKKIIDDVGMAATITSLAVPGGAIGNSAAVTGTVTNIISSIVDDPVQALGKETSTQAATSYLKNVLKISSAAATRLVALIGLSGGWDAFVSRTKSGVVDEDLKLEKK